MENIQRTFIAGDEWLYFKIYTGYKTAETIMREAIHPLSEYLLNAQIIDQWFYIRYSDPKYHIRIRFHLTDCNNIGEVILNFNQAIKDFVEENIIWKFQIDTYLREIERYGENTMELSEQLFFHDSRATIRIINLLKGNESENTRWLLGMKMIDLFLSDFEMNLSSKSDLMGNLCKGFAAEFGFDDKNSSRKQLADKYRKYKPEIERMMIEDLQDQYKEVIFQKSEGIKPIAQQILQAKDLQPEPSLNNLLGSYIHMMMNRLFRTNQRKYELVIYDFMSMYYNSQLKRKQKLFIPPTF